MYLKVDKLGNLPGSGVEIALDDFMPGSEPVIVCSRRGKFPVGGTLIYQDGRYQRVISAERVERAVENDDLLRIAAERNWSVIVNRDGYQVWSLDDLLKPFDEGDAPHFRKYRTLRAAFFACDARVRERGSTDKTL